MKDVNVVSLVCRLTKDPELRSLPSGTSICSLRVAFTSSWKNTTSGEWEDRPNYCDVTVWGAQSETVAKHMSKGRQIAVLGRLQWREWQAQDGTKRQALEIVADQVQFLGGDGGGEGGGGARSSGSSSGAPAAQPAGDFSDVPPTAADDDIPFLWQPISYARAKGHASRW